MATIEVGSDANPMAIGLTMRARNRPGQVAIELASGSQKMAIAAFGIRILSAAVVFITQISLARWMGATEFGTYVYVWTALLVLGDLVHLGLPLTAQRFVPEYIKTESFDLLRGYLRRSCWLTLWCGAFAAVLGALIVFHYEDSIERNLAVSFYLAWIALPAFALTFMLDGVARAYDWVTVALLPAYIFRPLILIAATAALHFSGMSLDAPTTMAILAASAWLAVLVQLAQLRRSLKTTLAAGPRVHDTRHWIGTALPMIVIWGLYTLLISTDVLVLKQFRPAEEVAQYFAVGKTLALVSIVYFAVAAASAHQFTTYGAARDWAGLSQFAARTVRWVFWPSLFLTAALLIAGRLVLMLFGPEFTAAYPIMAILAVGQLARASIGPAERLLSMLGHQRSCVLVYATAFAVNLGLALLLAPAYGSVGVAIATVTAFIVESGGLFFVAKRKLGIHMFILRSFRAAGEFHATSAAPRSAPQPGQ